MKIGDLVELSAAARKLIWTEPFHDTIGILTDIRNRETGMADYEDFTIDQGADVAIELHLQEPNGNKKNLTGHTVAAKMKRSYNSVDSDEIISFSTEVSTPETDGVCILSLTNIQTDALNPRLRYVYDVELSFEDSDNNTIIERILEGKVKVTPSVTRG